MNTAQKIIQKFGGQSALAAMIGKKQSTVQYWSKRGTIPSKWHRVLLEIAQKHDVSLTPSDLVGAVITPGIDTNESIPIATNWGELKIGAKPLPCYRLSNGERVFSMKGVVVNLMKTDGGQLTEYIKVKALRPFLPSDLMPDKDGKIPALIKFDTSGNDFTQFALGVPVEKFIDICDAYSKAFDAEDDTGIKLTPRQKEIAKNATRFLRACAKTGIIALHDEATGYQYEREDDALQFKLKLFLEEEMRPWEKTFPDELWYEFGRLTNWTGSLHKRPKYWGKLVMELIYGYLDGDVAEWLRANSPKARHGQNYHQWLTSQYGLKRLVEHIWMVIGMAKTCYTMKELRRKVSNQFGREEVQLSLFLPPPSRMPKPRAAEIRPSSELTK